MSMEDLLKGILGGSQPLARKPQASQDVLTDLLRGILGGMGAEQGQSGGSGATQLPDLLRGILGAGGQRAGSSGDLGGILGGILGGGSSSAATNPFLAPIVQALADKLGLSPAVAQTVVAFAVSKLLPALLGGLAASTGTAGERVTRKPAARQKQETEGLDLDHLLERMGSGQELEPAYLRSSGLVSQLSQQTGLDSDTALQSLQQVFGMFGSQVGTPPRRTQPQGLQHLLDTWETD